MVHLSKNPKAVRKNLVDCARKLLDYGTTTNTKARFPYRVISNVTTFNFIKDFKSPVDNLSHHTTCTLEQDVLFLLIVAAEIGELDSSAQTN